MHALFEKKLIPTKEAADLSGYTSDYIARLARTGKISGRRVGHTWFVDTESLGQFLAEQEDRKIDYARALARARETEYRAINSPLNQVARTLAAPLRAPRLLIANARSLRSHAVALSAALLVVVFAAFAAQVTTISSVAERTMALTSELAFGFTETFGDIPARIATKIEAVQHDVRVPALRVAKRITNASADLALAMPEVTVAALQMPIERESRVEQRQVVASRFVPVRVESVHSIEGVRSRAQGVYELVTHPSRITNALGGAYRRLGFSAYSNIVALFAGYQSLLIHAGAEALSLATNLRDGFAHTPEVVAGVPIAFGNAIVSLTHAAIRADVAFVYASAEAAPKSARAVVAFVGGAGDVLERVVSRVPALVTSAFLHATEVPALVAPTIAAKVFSAEYAGATRFLAFTKEVTTGYSRIVDTTGYLAYAGVTGSSALGRAALALIQKTPAVFEDTLLAIAGKSALTVEPLSHAPSAVETAPTASSTEAPTSSLLAALAPRLSSGDRLALFTYKSLKSFFNSTSELFTGLLSAPAIVVLPDGSRKSTHLAVTGVSSASLSSFRSEILNTVSEMIRVGGGATQTVNNYNTYTTIDHGYTGGSGGGSGGSTTVSDPLTLNTLTVNSALTVAGAFAVTSTGTSTFAGALDVAGLASTSALSTGSLTLSNSTGSIRCLHVDANGVVSATPGDCGTGSGGVSTSSPEVAGQIPYWTTTSGGQAQLGTIATSTLALGSNLSYSGTLGALVGGTGGTLTIATSTLYGTGSGGTVLSWNNGVPSWVATTTFSSGLTYTNGNVTNTGLLSLQQLGGGTAQTGAITFATSSNSSTGLTLGLNITNTSGAFTFAPALNGTLAIGNGGTGLSSLTGNQILYTNAAGTALLQAATSTLNIGGNAATATALQTARTINGISFDGTANIVVASTTLLANANTFSGNNTFSGTNTFSTVPSLGTLTGLVGGNNGALYQTATTTHSVSGPFTVTGTMGALVGGTNSTIVWTGLATTSQPTSSNLLVSNGAAGVYGVATSSVILGLNLSGSLTALGSGNSLSLSTSTLFGASTPGYVLTYQNGQSVWVATSTLSTITGTLAQDKGGTGITTYTSGDILFADSGGNLTKLAHGNTGEVLKISGGLPAWGTDLTLGGGGGAGAWSTTTDSLAVYPTDTTDVIVIGSSATSTLTSIFEVVGKSYFSNNVGIGTTTAGSLLSVGNTNGINFSTATSTFNSTGGINLNAGCFAVGGACLSHSNLSGTTAVANGGTGLSSFTGNSILYSNSGGTALAFAATTTHSVSGPFTVTGTMGALVGGTNSTIVWTGLATTSQPTSSNLLVSNGAAGVYGVATSSIGAGTGISFSGTAGAQIGGTSGTFSLATIAAGTLLANGTSATAIPTAVSTSTLFGTAAGGQILAFLNGQNTWQSTTTMSVGGNAANVTGTVVVGNGGTGQTTFTSSQLIYGNGAAALSSVATTTHSVSGPFTVTGTMGALVGGTNSTIVWTGLATTSALSSSNLLVSNGAAGVYGVATTSETCSSGVTCTAHTVLGGGGAISLAALGSAGVLGAVTATTPTVQATSTLFGTGTGGQVLGWSNATGGLAFIATSTSVTAVTGTWPIISSGGTTPNLTWGGIATSSPISAGGAVLYATGVNTFASVATSTRTYSGPFTVSGTLGYQIGGTNTTITYTGLATTTALTSSQLLYSTNGAAGVSGVSTTTASLGLGLLYSGTLGSLIGGSSGSLTIATTSLFTGTTGQVPYFSGTNTLVGTSSLFIATSQKVGIGTTNPGATLDITDSGTNVLSGWNGNLKLNGPGNPSVWLHDSTNNVGSFVGQANGITYFGRESSGSFSAYSMIVDSNGNLRVGASTATSYKFDVVGLGHFSGLVDAPNFVATSTTATSTFAGGLTVGTNKLVINNWNSNVGIGTTSPFSALSVSTTSQSSGLTSLFAVASTTGGSLFNVLGSGNVGIGTSTPGTLLSIGGQGTGWNFFDNSTTTKSGVGGIDIKTGCYAINGTCLSTSSGSNYFTNSGASTYLSTGTNLGIGSSTPWGQLSINPDGISGPSFVIGSSTGTKFIVTNAGDVGIGTKTPYAPLQIGRTGTGDLLILGEGGTGSGGGTQIVLGRYSDWNGRTYIQANVPGSGGGTLALNPGGGNVGIGSTTPGSLLSIGGQGTGWNFFDNSTTTKSGVGGIDIAGGCYAVGGTCLTAASLGATNYFSNSGIYTYLSTGSNLGIGTSTPYAALSVVGQIVGSYFTATSTTATSTFSGGLSVNNGSIISDLSTGLTSIQNLQVGALSFDTDSGQVSWFDMPVTSAASSGTIESYSAMIDGNALLTIYSESDGAGSIKNSRIGVGTTSPWGQLSINPTAANGTAPSFVIGSSTATKFIIDNRGYVGIGSTTPGSLLSIGGQGTGWNFFDNATSTKSGVGGINIASGCYAVNGTCLSTGGTNYFSNSGASTYLSTGTNLGIGTSSPYARLSVTSAVGAIPFVVASSTGYNLFSLNQYGAATFGSTTSSSIFINGGGTTTPTYRASNDIAIGNEAFSYYSITATDNIALGYQALYGSSTVLMTGINNFAAGRQALYKNTTGGSNNALGYQSLTSNTSGSNNNAFGQSALTTNTTGDSNNALGFQSLYSNTIGTDNNSLGYQSLYSNTTGVNNNALGSSALYYNTTGSENNASGFQALNSNTTGSSNTAFGNSALVSNTTGSYNTALGALALYSSDGGSFNTAIGYRALRNVVTGYDNIMIGHVANTGGNNITTGRNNIALGYNAGIGTSTNSTNFLNIGNSFFGSMIATTTSTSLPTSFANAAFAIATSSLLANTTFAVQNSSTGNTVASFFSNAGASLLTILNNGNIGIGTTSPYARLSIAGEVVANNFTATSTTATSTFSGGFTANNNAIISDLSTGITSISSLSIGATAFEADAGVLSWVDMAVTSAASSGTIESYTAHLNGNPALTVYSQSDGAGGLLFSPRVGVGTSTPSKAFAVEGTVALKNLGTGTGGNYLCIDTSTWEVLRGNGSSCTASSLKFKENVNNLTYGLADVLKLRPVSYNYKPGLNMGDGVKLGFIAEEMNLVIPEVVTHDNIGGIFGLDYPLLTSVLTSAVQQLNGKVDALASSTISIAAGGEIAITNASTLGGKLLVSGGVLADSYEVPQAEVASFTLGSTTVTGVLPSSVLTANGVDIYKLATYNLSGITALAAALEEQKARITSLESRVALLESGAIVAAGSTPFSTTSLIAALDSFGAFIKSGLAQFGTLIADQFVAATNSAGTSSAGTVNVISGNTVAQINNAYVLPTTKVFVTFNSELTGTWHVSDKQAGSFRVVLSAPQTGDVSFDYFLVQTDGQFATSIATSTDSGPSTILSNGQTPPPLPPSTPPPSTPPPPPSGDTQAPTVTLLGDAAMQLTVGDTFTDAGATALDDIDGDLTTRIIVSGTVDTATAGVYNLTYSVTDAAGNTGSASRLVTVVAAPTP